MKLAELLKKYSAKEVKSFVQYDIFYLGKERDDVLNPDKDGFATSCGITQELMSVEAGVRIFARPDVDKKRLTTSLRKALSFLARGDIQARQAEEIQKTKRLDDLIEFITKNGYSTEEAREAIEARDARDLLEVEGEIPF